MRMLPARLLVLSFFFLAAAFIVRPVHAQTDPSRPPGPCQYGTAGLEDEECAAINRRANSKSSIQPIQEYIDGNLSPQLNSAIFTGMNSRNIKSDTVISLVGSGNAEYDLKTGNISALSSLSSGLAMLYTRPANTEEYVADLMHDSGFNVARPVYAQGLGFSALSPVLTTWKVFRNIAYFFYVILFLIIGFMIMFRQKIGNQAAVGVQQALPNIIISLLAVTFSYAIAGLLIDMMYLAMFFIVSVFQPYFAVNLQDYGLNNNIFEVGRQFLTNPESGGLGTAFDSISLLVKQATANGNVIDALGDAGGLIAGLTFAIVFAIALVFQIFRLFFELLKTYISIIISIVLSPLALMLGALPGNNAFSAWIKALVANLAVFPAVLIIIVLSFMLTSNGLKPEYKTTNQLTETGSGFLPPYLTGTGSPGAIQAILGLGILLILPDVVTQVKKSLGGSGGIFEQFANNFTSALDKGWKGGELVPGVGLTNTNNIGMSGNNLFNKMFTGTKESNQRATDKKFAIMPRGLVGTGTDIFRRKMRRDSMNRLAQHKEVPDIDPLEMTQKSSPETNETGTVKGLKL
jgi:hypothetical protein